MSSYAWAIEDLAPCAIAYWLPPGGKDNGVWADKWALISDLDADDIAEVLYRLADADIGGYVAIPGGRRARARGPVGYSLWVDLTQYHRAENMLMLWMRGRQPDLLPRPHNPNRPPRSSQAIDRGGSDGRQGPHADQTQLDIRTSNPPHSIPSYSWG